MEVPTMYMSLLIGKTQKKYDNDFDLKSQELIFRAGMFREIEHGSYSALPLGVKTIEKIINLIIKYIEEKGFQRIFLPLEDNFVENTALTVRNDIKSYRELPALIYDIQNQQRDEVKAKYGFLGCRNYKGFKGCSFHESNESQLSSYNDFIEFYMELFKEFGVEVVPLLDYFSRGKGKYGHSFIYKADKGNRTLYTCTDCGYDYLEETANFFIDENEKNSSKSLDDIEEIYTPDIKTINELTGFLGVESKNLAKTLLVKAKDEIVAVVLRGDRELNKYKLSQVLQVPTEGIFMAEEKDIEKIKTVAGFVGPVGLEGIRIIVDREITQGTYITGSNKKDYHIKNVSIKDIPNSTIADISYIKEDDRCPKCGGPLQRGSGVDIGRIFKTDINIKNFNYKDSDGITHEIFGLYHFIDIYKLLTAIVEKHHDEEGIVWPIKIAPYQVLVSVLNTKNEDKVLMGKRIYEELKEINVDVLLDERNAGAGAKFKDADLLGIPIRITIGRRTDEKIVEFKERNKKEKEELKIHEALGKTMKILKKEGII